MTIDRSALPDSSVNSPQSPSAAPLGRISQTSAESCCRTAASSGVAQPQVVSGGLGLSAEAIRALPAAFPFDPVVPAAFGISRSAAYRALAAGQLPIRTLRLGRKLIATRADLMAALGIDEAPPSPAGSTDGGQGATATWGTGPPCDHNKEGDR